MNWYEPKEPERVAWVEWVKSRPASVRKVIDQYGFAPWKLYLLTSSNHRVFIYSFDEPEGDAPVTMRVCVTGRFNCVAFERKVFGIAPEELVECDLPEPDEPLGSLDMSPEEARRAMAAMKAAEPS